MAQELVEECKKLTPVESSADATAKILEVCIKSIDIMEARSLMEKRQPSKRKRQYLKKKWTKEEERLLLETVFEQKKGHQTRRSKKAIDWRRVYKNFKNNTKTRRTLQALKYRFTKILKL
jgi:hypothetical protein